MATIEVILTEDIGKIGEAGEVVKVRAGYGRNYLLPQGKAMLATASRVKEIEHQRRVIEELQSKAIAGYKEVARQAGSVPLKFEMQASKEGKLFGSVTNSDVAGLMAAAGVEVDRRKITLAGGGPIKSVGEHEGELRLHREVIVPLKIEVVSSGEPPADDDDDALEGMDDGSNDRDRDEDRAPRDDDEE